MSLHDRPSRPSADRILAREIAFVLGVLGTATLLVLALQRFL